MIVRRRCSFGIFAKYSARPTIVATPAALSFAPSNQPSRWPTTIMFSSVVPGSVAQIVAVLRFGARRIGAALSDEVAHREAVGLTEREGRHRAVHRVELRAQVAGNALYDEDGG